MQAMQHIATSFQEDHPWLRVVVNKRRHRMEVYNYAEPFGSSEPHFQSVDREITGRVRKLHDFLSMHGIETEVLKPGNMLYFRERFERCKEGCGAKLVNMFGQQASRSDIQNMLCQNCKNYF